MKDVKVGDRIKVTTDMPEGQPIRLGDELTVMDVNDDGKFCAVLAHNESNVVFFLIEAWFDVVPRTDKQVDQKLKKFGLILRKNGAWTAAQIEAKDAHEAIKAIASQGFVVWRYFDMETEGQPFFLCLLLLTEIAGAENINNPDAPVRLGVIKESEK